MVTPTDADPPERDAQVDRFNDVFYSAEPADYLRTRWQMLLLVGARSDDLSRLFSEGLTFDGITIGPNDADESETDTTVPDFDRYLTTEVVLLHHHAAETLLRMYVAHAAKPQIPWIDLADRKAFGKFKELVRDHFVTVLPSASEIGHVCLGSSTVPVDHDEAEWANAVTGLGEFLRSAASTFLDDAPVYNSLKHGLGGTPSNVSMALGEHLIGHGPSVDYPEATKWENDVRTWSLTTRWIRRTEALGLTDVAIRMIDSIVRVGAARTGPPDLRPDGLSDLFFPASLRPSDFRSSDVGPAHRMSWQVIAEQRIRE